LDSIEAYVAFALLMELESFSAVGRKLGVSQSTVSKHIAALEATLGVPLFVRTTRNISPTADAVQIYPHVQRMLESLDEVRAAARGQNPDAVGNLRVSVPVSFGRQFVVPLLPKFLAKYPSVSVEIALNETPPDLLRDGFELAIALDKPDSGSIVFRTIRVFQRVVVASPSYLEAFGEPLSPADLKHHRVVYPALAADAHADFDSDLGREVVHLNCRIRTNSDEVAYAEAKSGRAISIVPNWLAMADVASGKMSLLLSDYVLPPISVVIAYPQTRMLSRRARAFIDFMAPELGKTTSQPAAIEGAKSGVSSTKPSVLKD
jgi:DNA-binding transcriptional LysR family regulator